MGEDDFYDLTVYTFHLTFKNRAHSLSEHQGEQARWLLTVSAGGECGQTNIYSGDPSGFGGIS